jgi:hypothetical protein
MFDLRRDHRRRNRFEEGLLGEPLELLYDAAHRNGTIANPLCARLYARPAAGNPNSRIP